VSLLCHYLVFVIVFGNVQMLVLWQQQLVSVLAMIIVQHYKSRDFFINLMQGRKKDVDFRVFFVFLIWLIMHPMKNFQPFV
jgi:hypothetical protein